MLNHVQYSPCPADWRPAGQDASNLVTVSTKSKKAMVFGIADGVTNCSDGKLASQLAVNCLLHDVARRLQTRYQRVGSEQFQEEMQTFAGVYERILHPCFSQERAKRGIGTTPGIGKYPEVDTLLQKLKDDRDYHRKDYAVREEMPQNFEIPPQTTFTCFYLIRGPGSSLAGYFGIGDSPILVKARSADGERILFNDLREVEQTSNLYDVLEFAESTNGQDKTYAALFHLGTPIKTFRDIEKSHHLQAGIEKVLCDEELDALLTTDDAFCKWYMDHLAKSASQDIPFATRVDALAKQAVTDRGYSPWGFFHTAAKEMNLDYEPRKPRSEFEVWRNPENYAFLNSTQDKSYGFGKDDVTLLGISYRPGRREMLEGKIRRNGRKLREKLSLYANPEQK